MIKRFVSFMLAAACVILAVFAPSCAGGANEPNKNGEKPINLNDGSYDVEVESSSSMFRIVKCVLTVQNGEMHAALTMSGKGYGALFMGKAADAPEKPDNSCIAFTEDADGAKVFIVPVSALDAEIDCAAWSIRREQWYDRVLKFRSDSLPKNAFK